MWLEYLERTRTDIKPGLKTGWNDQALFASQEDHNLSCHPAHLHIISAEAWTRAGADESREEGHRLRSSWETSQNWQANCLCVPSWIPVNKNVKARAVWLSRSSSKDGTQGPPYTADALQACAQAPTRGNEQGESEAPVIVTIAVNLPTFLTSMAQRAVFMTLILPLAPLRGAMVR